MTPEWYYLAGYCFRAMQALPLILLFTYPLGRRGHGRLAVWGMERLVSLCLCLCCCSALFLLLEGGRMLSLSDWASDRQRHNTLISLVLALLACALGAFFLGLVQRANRRLPDFPPSQQDEDCRYDGAVIRRPMLLLVPVLLCQFALLGEVDGRLLWTKDWWEIILEFPGGCLLDALSQLSVAGGLALLALHAHARTPLLSDRNRDRAVRWCAAWAVLGQLIVCLKSWAKVLDKPCSLLLAGQPLSLVWSEVGTACLAADHRRPEFAGPLPLGRAALSAAMGAPPLAGAPAAAVPDAASPCTEARPPVTILLTALAIVPAIPQARG